MQLNYGAGYLTGGNVDYGYKPSKVYNYTFHAGVTCASPEINILINDDAESEKVEKFEIFIIEPLLPFGVVAGKPAEICINDNDSKSRCHER